MPTPSYVQNYNVKFDGTMTRAVQLSNSNQIKKLILWDFLFAGDQQLVEQFMAANQGATADLWDLFQVQKADNGARYSELIKVYFVGTRPTTPRNVPHTPRFTYYDGTEWKYIDDDQPFCEGGD